ncbi:MAG: diacylglycerol kinase family protein [Pseudomonadota bacterium]
MNKYLIIINRFSGGGRVEKYESVIFDYFSSRNYAFKVEYTKGSNDALRIAKEYSSSDYNYYVICGGDGTINEVINGLSSYSKVLIVLPFGTVNIFAKEYKISKNINKALHEIFNGEKKQLYIGNSNGKKFILMQSVGIDSFVVKCINHNLKKLFGRGSYFLMFIKAIFLYKYPLIKIRANNQEYQGTFILVSQSIYYAGFLKITPDAKMDKGLFDVCLLKKGGFYSLIKFLLFVILNINHHNKDCIYFCSDNLLVSGPAICSQSDGELSDELPLDISIYNQKINFLVPNPE